MIRVSVSCPSPRLGLFGVFWWLCAFVGGVLRVCGRRCVGLLVCRSWGPSVGRLVGRSASWQVGPLVLLSICPSVHPSVRPCVLFVSLARPCGCVVGWCLVVVRWFLGLSCRSFGRVGWAGCWFFVVGFFVSPSLSLLVLLSRSFALLLSCSLALSWELSGLLVLYCFVGLCSGLYPSPSYLPSLLVPFT